MVYGSYSIETLVQVSRDSQVTHDYPRNIPGWCMVATALTPLSKYPGILKLPMIIPGTSRGGGKTELW